MEGETFFFLFLNVIYSLYTDSSINVQQIWFILRLVVHCLERCIDKSNKFASFKNNTRVKL